MEYIGLLTGYGIEAIGAQLLEHIKPHFRNRKTHIMEFTRKDKYSLPLHGETILVPSYIGSLAIVRRRDKARQRPDKEQREECEKPHFEAMISSRASLIDFITARTKYHRYKSVLCTSVLAVAIHRSRIGIGGCFCDDY